MRRNVLGILALLLLGMGVLAALRGPPDGSARGFAGGCIRMGLVLGALWLALPQIQGVLTRLPRRVVGWLWGFINRCSSPPQMPPASKNGDDGRAPPPPALRPRRRRSG